MVRKNNSYYRIYTTAERFVTTDKVIINNSVVRFIPHDVYELESKWVPKIAYLFPKWKFGRYTEENVFHQEWKKAHTYKRVNEMIIPLSNVRRIENTTEK